MSMRKVLSILLSFSGMALCLTACGGEGNSTSEGERQSAVPKYTVQIEVECGENLLFSRYDVDIYVDDTEIGTLDHGATDTYQVELEEGVHTLTATKEDDAEVDGTIKFTVGKDEEKALRYKLSLSGDQVEIEEAVEKEISEENNSSKSNADESTAEEKKEVAEPEDEATTLEEEESVLTIDNCDEFAAILSIKDEFDPSVKEFAQTYSGRTIEFDGNTAYVSHHEDYSTRFDYLVYGGDYSETSVSGPSFQFEDVSYYDLHLTGEDVPDSFGVGLNIHIIAKIDEYDESSGLLKLEPVSITMR